MNNIFFIFSLIVILYLIINFISYLPWSKYFYKDIFFSKDEDILITIDDGPSKYTKEMLDLLEKYNSKAVFFINGENISGYENVLKEINENGHEIGNHSYKHYFFNPFLKSAIIYDLERNEKIIKDKINIDNVDKVRTPHGYQTFGLMDYIQRNDKDFLYWDRILFDFIPGVPFFIIKKQIDKFIEKKGIICLHSNKKSVRALKYLLKRIN